LLERGDNDVTADELAFLDRVAVLTASDVPEFDAACALYESDERLRVLPVITTYLRGGAQKIELANEFKA
jgi:hypothetical protein